MHAFLQFNWFIQNFILSKNCENWLKIKNKLEFGQIKILIISNWIPRAQMEGESF